MASSQHRAHVIARGEHSTRDGLRGDVTHFE